MKKITEIVDEMVRLKNGKIGRNDRCFCGSGKKYKKCCLLKSDLEVMDTLLKDNILPIKTYLINKDTIEILFSKDFRIQIKIKDLDPVLSSSFCKEWYDNNPLINWKDGCYWMGVMNPVTLKDYWNNLIEQMEMVRHKVFHENLNLGQFVVKYGISVRELGFCQNILENMDESVMCDEELEERKLYFSKIDYREIVGGNSVEITPQEFNDIVGFDFLPIDCEEHKQEDTLFFYSSGSENPELMYGS